MIKKYITQALSLIIVLTMFTGCVQVDESTEIDSNYNPEERLRELNITLPTPPQPVANYVNGVRAGNLIFLAGKGPKYPDGRELTGKLGGNITIGDAPTDTIEFNGMKVLDKLRLINYLF